MDKFGGYGPISFTNRNTREIMDSSGQWIRSATCFESLVARSKRPCSLQGCGWTELEWQVLPYSRTPVPNFRLLLPGPGLVVPIFSPFLFGSTILCVLRKGPCIPAACYAARPALWTDLSSWADSMLTARERSCPSASAGWHQQLPNKRKAEGGFHYLGLSIHFQFARLLWLIRLLQLFL